MSKMATKLSKINQNLSKSQKWQQKLSQINQNLFKHQSFDF
jgi:hypothetical protein